MNFTLNAREEISLELKGKIRASSARDLLPNNLTPLIIDNYTPVCLQLAHVEDINWDIAPFVKMHFDKALWNIAVTHQNKKGWFIAVCDLNHPIIRHVSTTLFRYPVRHSNFSFMEKRKSLITHQQPESGGEMKCHIELGIDQLPIDQIHPLYVNRRNGIHEIKVIEQPAAFSRLSKVDIIKDDISQEIFGYPVDWEKECYVFRGRTFNWIDITEKG